MYGAFSCRRKDIQRCHASQFTKGWWLFSWNKEKASSKKDTCTKM